MSLVLTDAFSLRPRYGVDKEGDYLQIFAVEAYAYQSNPEVRFQLDSLAGLGPRRLALTLDSGRYAAVDFIEHLERGDRT